MERNKRALGAAKEALAEAYLRGQGYEILERNFYSRMGEIDLIAREDGYLVFLEVKYRKSSMSGHPAEAVTYRKQQKIYAAARYYLYKKGFPTDMPCRFDVVAIQGEEITLIKNAFGGI